MKLPNLDNADVSEEKITEYLLSSTHRDGRHKAAFFTSFGFRPEDWQALAKALQDHARQHDVTKEEPSPFGVRYVVEGPILAPDRRSPNVRVVWFIDTGHNKPRFVTAYPLRGAGHD